MDNQEIQEVSIATIDNEIQDIALPKKERKSKNAPVTNEQERVLQDKEKEPENVQVNNKFQVGDFVEVHGLPECKEYFSFGKVIKVLDEYMYAIDGTSEPIKKGIIGHTSRLIRSFHESNLRKVIVQNG